MARATGIQAHKVFKLGKAAAKRDPRNLKFAAVLRAAPPPLPARYDFDATHAGIPTPMFANDERGDCVIAGRAHQTLRFENIEQGSVLMIKDSDVLREYFAQTGGVDSGLIVLESLKLWRKRGWRVGRHRYFSQAFAELNPRDHSQMRRAIYADIGIGIGLNLPRSAQLQMQTGQTWELTTGPSSRPGSWGGHYVYVCGYTPKGPVCVTWGQKQQMTWAWLDRYCDEAYAIFDAKNRFKKSIIAQAKLKSFLKTVTRPKRAAVRRRSGK